MQHKCTCDRTINDVLFCALDIQQSECHQFAHCHADTDCEYGAGCIQSCCDHPVCVPSCKSIEGLPGGLPSSSPVFNTLSNSTLTTPVPIDLDNDTNDSRHILCGENLVGHYNGSSFLFTVTVLAPSDLTVYLTVSELDNATYLRIHKLHNLESTESHSDHYDHGILTVNGLNSGDFVVEIYSDSDREGAEGEFIVATRCQSQSDSISKSIANTTTTATLPTTLPMTATMTTDSYQSTPVHGQWTSMSHSMALYFEYDHTARAYVVHVIKPKNSWIYWSGTRYAMYCDILDIDGDNDQIHCDFAFFEGHHGALDITNHTQCERTDDIEFAPNSNALNSNGLNSSNINLHRISFIVHDTEFSELTSVNTTNLEVFYAVNSSDGIGSDFASPHKSNREGVGHDVLSIDLYRGGTLNVTSFDSFCTLNVPLLSDSGRVYGELILDTTRFMALSFVYDNVGGVYRGEVVKPRDSWIYWSDIGYALFCDVEQVLL